MKKISDEEVNEALIAWNTCTSLMPSAFNSHALIATSAMRAALEAAQRVRKARKADRTDALDRSVNLIEKHVKGSPDKPTEPELRFKVGDRVVHLAQGAGVIAELDLSDTSFRYCVHFDNGTCFWPDPFCLTPAKPELKFEVGKSYRTRDGKRAELTGLSKSVFYPLLGQLGGATATWTDSGVRLRGEESPSDLVGPWEE